MVSIKRFLKYTLVGGSTFALDLFLLFVFIDVAKIDYLLATGLAFFVAVAINYIISRQFVFSGTLRGVGSGFLIFIFIAFAGMGTAVGLMAVFVGFFHWHYLVSRILIAMIVGIWNYLMNLYVNFKVSGK